MKTKTLIALLFASLSLSGGAADPALTVLPELPADPDPKWEMTLGGGGEVVDHESTFGLDLSLSRKTVSNVWVGLAQSVYWEPTFAGTSDVFVDWAQNLWKERLYLNVGWSGGVLYGGSCVRARTGPEATFEFYTKGNAFLFAGINYDVLASGWRYSFGIGITW